MLAAGTSSPAQTPTGDTGQESPLVTAPGFEDDWAGVRTIVIDPGHGGDEVGAVSSSGLQEKNLALDLARRLRTRLENNQGFRVILTRENDRQVPLLQRTAIANNARADLFISIHVNSSRRTSAHGTETYFMALTASDEEARNLAKLENLGELDAGAAGKEIAPNAPLNAGTSDSNSDLQLVLWGMAQSEHLNRSSRLAEFIQDEMDTLHAVESRGVKQAPFTVLMGATMPAVLVEVAFLSNTKDVELLANVSFRENVAGALEQAIIRHKIEYERATGQGGSGTLP
jgi:N-acetylmuramoyl-L-alanine amidase